MSGPAADGDRATVGFRRSPLRPLRPGGPREAVAPGLAGQEALNPTPVSVSAFRAARRRWLRRGSSGLAFAASGCSS